MRKTTPFPRFLRGITGSAVVGFLAFFSLSGSNLQAQQEYETLKISSGFNQDVIAEEAPAQEHTTASIDGSESTANFALMSVDYPEATTGLPVNGIINSVSTEGLQFHLADYSANNSLKLTDVDDSGTLELADPQAVNKIFILGTSGSGEAYFTGVIHFTDGTTQNITIHKFPDWYNNSPSVTLVTSGIGRVSLATGDVDNDTNNPKLFSVGIPIEEEEQSKAIEKVDFTKTDGEGHLNIFGLSAAFTPDCAKPSQLSLNSVTEQEAGISWHAEGNESSWTLVYGPAGFDVNSEGTTVTNLTDTITTLTGLDSDSNYQVYVKANCTDTETSNWTGPLSFATACGVTSIPFSQDFEGVTAPELPNCSSIETLSGGQDWATTDAIYGLPDDFTGNVLYYHFTSYNMGAADAWYFTEGITLEAGVNYQLTFQYGNNSTSYTEKLKVAFGTSPAADQMDQQLVDYTDISDGQAHIAEIAFSVNADGVYYFGFNAHSPSGQYYLYLDNINIDVAPSCLHPTDLISSDLTENTATLSWEAGADESQWALVYGEPGFDPDSADVETLEDTAYTLTGLSQNTTYEAYIKALCSDTDESSWEGPISFTTSCGVADLPFTQDFENVTPPDLPACATLETLSGNDWKTVSFVSGFDGNALNYSYDINQDGNTWYFTQGIEMEAGVEYQITYKYGNSGSWPEKLKVAFGTDPEADAMDSVLVDHTNILSTENDLIYFSVPSDGVYYFGFNAHSDANENQLYVDDIEIKAAPTCIAPSGLEVAEVTATSADLSWASNGDETTWKVIYGESGFNPESEGNTLTVEGGDPQTSLENLTSGTSYEVYVKAVCDTDNESELSDPVSFATLCESTTVPFLQDFEGVTPPAVPVCATLENDGNGHNWTTYNPEAPGNYVSANGFEGNVLSYEYDLNNAADAWYFTQGIELEAGVNYQISYKYGNGSGSGANEKMKVTFGDSPDADGILDVLADHSDISGIDLAADTIVFTVDTDGVYYFGFKAYSDANQYYLFVDDIAVKVGPTCPKPTGIAFSYITDQSVTVSWDSDDNATAWQVIDVEQGQDPDDFDGTPIEVTGDPQTTITGLQPDTDYTVYVRANCGEDEYSDWASAEVTTNVTGLENTYLCDAIELTPNDGCAGGPYTNVDAFEQPGEPTGSCLNNFHGTNSVWFSFVATDEVATVTTNFGSTDFTTELVAFEAPEDCTDMSSLGAEIGCAGNGDDLTLFDLTPGDTYYIRVAGFNNAEGNFCIEVQSQMGVDHQVFKEFTYYPNPTSGALRLTAGQQIDHVSVFNLLGQKIIETAPNTLHTQLDLSSLQSGVYLMKVNIKGVTKTFRVVRK